MIPAPFMTDANGAFSRDVCYQLTSGESGSYLLKVIADEDWINQADRAFPVEIDPIVLPYTATAFAFANVFEHGSTVSTGSEIYIGYDKNTDCGFSDAYIRFNLNSGFSDQYTLLSGKLTYTRENHGAWMTAVGHEVYVVDPNFDPQTVTYETRPEQFDLIGEEHTTFVFGAQNTKDYSFDLQYIDDDQIAF